jgi:biopolymer transport protein ExbD
MSKFRKKRELEEISAASMSDIAFLLLVFFMVASVFFVKEGIISNLPKKDSAQQQVKKEDVYIVRVTGDNISLEHPSFGTKDFTETEKFREELMALDIPGIKEEKFAVLTNGGGAKVQKMTETLAVIRERGFLRISMQKMAVSQ